MRAWGGTKTPGQQVQEKMPQPQAIDIVDNIFRSTGVLIGGAGGGGGVSGLIGQSGWPASDLFGVHGGRAVRPGDMLVTPLKESSVKWTPPSPPLKPPIPVPVGPSLLDTQQLTEYATIAKQVGVSVPGLDIEEFKQLLVKLDYPVYSLKAVVAYMDDKSGREGNGGGWRWYPVRDKDYCLGRFGVVDIYGRSFDGYTYTAETNRQTYKHTIPLHALKRMAAIERLWQKPIAFMVSDYAPKPQYRPDPFLMAVIHNPDMHNGTGRFVVDFWDEPGFGIEQMLC